MGNRTRTLLAGVLCAVVIPALDASPSRAAAGGGGGGDGLDGRAIVDRASEHNRVGFRTGQATLHMKIKTRGGDLLERKLLVRTAKGAAGQRTRITFLEPKDQYGIELLMVEQPGGGSLQYLWLPRFKRQRRITGGAKQGRFQGSDFTYADLESQDAKRDGEVVRLPDEPYGKLDCYHVRVTPKAREGEAYGRVEMWISKKTWIPVKVSFFDRSLRPLKVLKVKRLKKVDGRYVPTSMVMANSVEHTETRLDINDIDSHVVFPASVFDPAALGK